MMLRTVLLVAGLSAAAFSFAPSALAGPIPELAEIPTLAPTIEAPLLPLDVSAQGDVEAEVSSIVHVGGGASVAVRSEVSTVPAQGDSAHDPERPASDSVATGSVAPIVAASAAVGLLALLAFCMEAVRAAASNVWTHVARIVRGAVGVGAGFALFSRIRRSDLLENPVRASIHAAVTERPGLSLTDVQSCTGIAWGTAVHHLQRLEMNGIVVSATRRAHRRYFVAGTPAAMRRNDIAVMAHPTARRIATLVSVQPGIDQTGICRALGLNNPAASKHLRGFEAQGLVLAERDGRKRLYHSTPSMDAALPFVQDMQVGLVVSLQRHVVPNAPAAALG